MTPRTSASAILSDSSRPLGRGARIVATGRWSCSTIHTSTPSRTFASTAWTSAREFSFRNAHHSAIDSIITFLLSASPVRGKISRQTNLRRDAQGSRVMAGMRTKWRDPVRCRSFRQGGGSPHSAGRPNSEPQGKVIHDQCLGSASDRARCDNSCARSDCPSSRQSLQPGAASFVLLRDSRPLTCAHGS